MGQRNPKNGSEKSFEECASKSRYEGSWQEVLTAIKDCYTAKATSLH